MSKSVCSQTEMGQQNSTSNQFTTKNCQILKYIGAVPVSSEMALLGFIQDHDIKVLNVAGPRASKQS